jgi:uncharacterized protein YbbC (DUF1343 family)
VLLMDRDVLDSPELGIEIAAALHKLYPENYKLDRIHTLLANQHVLDMLRNGTDPQRIADDWREPLTQFEARRAQALLY